ncbi:MAG: hypothetical protein HYZ51_00205, partial [Candidatus Doudnabacteria bacterium]|nr:hypothetical protein [Candidatus Doudnabacteria bacterium]
MDKQVRMKPVIYHQSLITYTLALALGVFFSAFPHQTQAFVVEASQVFLNDPAFTLNAQDTDKQWALVKAGFIEAWEKTAGSEAVVVAVVDTGIDA